jgi:hypothetical protein
VPAPERPVPPPSPREPVYTADGWTRAPDDPAGPIVRVVALEADDAVLASVLASMHAILSCYEVASIAAPAAQAELQVRRHQADISGPPRYEFGGTPDPFVACAEPGLRATLAPLPSAQQDAAADPGAKVDRAVIVLRAYPRRDAAPELRVERDESVTERAGAGCWVREHFPCKPHKHCMAPRWEPVRCPDSPPNPSTNPSPDARRARQ